MQIKNTPNSNLDSSNDSLEFGNISEIKKHGASSIFEKSTQATENNLSIDKKSNSSDNIMLILVILGLTVVLFLTYKSVKDSVAT